VRPWAALTMGLLALPAAGDAQVRTADAITIGSTSTRDDAPDESPSGLSRVDDLQISNLVLWQQRNDATRRAVTTELRLLELDTQNWQRLVQELEGELADTYSCPASFDLGTRQCREPAASPPSSSR
jgi:hypothetical protein